MGSFSERGVRIEFMRMPPGATWISADDRARRLFVVLSGDGAAVGESATRLSALQLQSGGTLELSATTEMTLFVIGLPPNRDAIAKSLKSMIWRNYRDHLSRSQPGLPQLPASAVMPAGAYLAADNTDRLEILLPPSAIGNSCLSDNRPLSVQFDIQPNAGFRS
jgi:hypothetical protein